MMKREKRLLWVTGTGLTFILLGEFSILLNIEPLKIWVTPFCWTGYILCLDSLLYQKRGFSFIQNHPLEALLSVPISAGLWAIFEGYNLLLKNWEYVGVPTNPFIAYLGYFWSFGTILPALLETNDLLEYQGLFKKSPLKPSVVPRKALLFSFGMGALFLIYPLFTASPFDFPPIWLGFIFLLEPLNYRLGGESLLRRLEKGETQRLLTLLLTGGIMGILWEFWNYWAEAKWIYRIPVPRGIKIFEMPLLGFLGFFPFAVECYVMYHFVRSILMRIYTPYHSDGPGT